MMRDLRLRRRGVKLLSQTSKTIFLSKAGFFLQPYFPAKTLSTIVSSDPFLIAITPFGSIK
jgi:hypothetical protein